jgi:uncharacterized membrane protein YdbT with pleckstrin-like domain
MAYPNSLLAPGEVIIKQMRPHWRALTIPILVFILTTIGWLWLFSVIGFEFLRWIIAGIGIFVLVFYVIIPFARWYSSEYVFTDRRVITRRGIIAKSGKDVPLAKINNISFNQSVLGRILNYGDLVIDSANSDGPVIISDVPSVETIQRDLYTSIETDTVRRRSNEE